MRPYFFLISSCLALLSDFRSSERCLISSLLLMYSSSSRSSRDDRLQRQQQQQQHTVIDNRRTPPTTAIAMIKASKFTQHTPQRAWDSWQTEAGGNTWDTGYSVQEELVLHHRQDTLVRQVSQVVKLLHDAGAGVGLRAAAAPISSSSSAAAQPELSFSIAARFEEHSRGTAQGARTQRHSGTVTGTRTED